MSSSVYSASPEKDATVEISFYNQFEAAYNAQDDELMASLVEENTERVVAEVKRIVDEILANKEAPEINRLFLAEKMAAVYNDVTGDIGFLKEVKVRTFEAKLSNAETAEPIGGVVTVKTLAGGEMEHYFYPGNIVIKKGVSVEWVNSDSVDHLLASMPVIGKGGLFSPTIQPNGKWSYLFKEPGDYYYICFIHKVMYGKVTVVE